MLTWFNTLFGFDENDYTFDEIKNLFTIDISKLKSKINNKEYHIGTFEQCTLQELIDRANNGNGNGNNGTVKIHHIVTNDVFDLINENENKDAIFQVASQFNALEFYGPDMTPADGVTGYQNDKTQGPSCALAAAPATVYRNYFNTQINNLDKVQNLLKQKLNNTIFTIKNGYLFSDKKSLDFFNNQLKRELLNDIFFNIKVSIQWNIEAPFNGKFKLRESGNVHLVSQVFCSAASIGYNQCKDYNSWEKLSKIILYSTYYSTLLAGVINSKSNKVF